MKHHTFVETGFVLILVFGVMMRIPSVQADSIIPTSPWNPLTQQRLAGEFGGLRSATETNYGVAINAEMTADLFNNTMGGAGIGKTYSGSLSLSLAADLQKSLGWEGGSFKTTWVWLSGLDISSYVIHNALTVSGIAGSPNFLCYEFWLQQNFLHDEFSIRGGLLGISSEFMSSETASLFVNSSFGTPALFALNVAGGVPTTTLPTPGVRLAWKPNPWFTARSAFAEVNPFNGRQLTGSTSTGGILWLNEVAATWNKEINSMRLPGTVKLGVWALEGRNVPASTLRDDDIFYFTGPQGRSNEGYYALCDQQLTAVYEQTDLPQPHSVRTSKGLSTFTMVGFSPQGSSPVGFSTEGGLVYTGLIPTRDDDKLGIAFCYAQLGSGYINAGNADGFPGTGFEAVTELSYLMQVTPALSIQPDVQYILHPGGSQLYGNAFVVGLRAVVEF